MVAKVLWVDNTAALAVATENDFTHETVKHVTVKVRFLQECVQHKIIRLTYVATRKNVSDMMTKQSNGPQFNLKAHRDFVLGCAHDAAASAPFAGVAVRSCGSQLRFAVAVEAVVFDFSVFSLTGV
jgi:hypothetical protein